MIDVAGKEDRRKISHACLICVSIPDEVKKSADLAHDDDHRHRMRLNMQMMTLEMHMKSDSMSLDMARVLKEQELNAQVAEHMSEVRGRFALARFCLHSEG